jgi:2-keto-3-deoxy-L-rhamnonate aldolase RhmA
MASFRDMTTTKVLKVGTYIGEFATPGIGQILKSAGCEFVFLDMEHSGFSFETIKQALRTLHDADIATLVRPPSKENHHIARTCDVGAQGICPPMLGTVEEARACVDAINYPPTGKRGAAFAIAHDDYQPRSVADAITFANNKTSFIALLETAQGVENCEAIAAMDGVDCLWIGHFDLSNSLGVPGEFDNPLFVDAVARIMKAAKAAGKSVGRLVNSPEEAKKLNGEGCDFICYAGDIWLFHRVVSEGVSEIRSMINDS